MLQIQLLDFQSIFAMRAKDECKINFDFRPSFTGSFSESDFTCQIDFGFETGEEEKCNPNTVSFPL